MDNVWLSDFRDSLYSLGKAVWDHQNGRDSFTDLLRELQRVAEQVVNEFVDVLLPSGTVDRMATGCVMHMTVCDAVIDLNGVERYISGTSLVDKVDLSKTDAYAYAVKHMTEFLKSGKS